MAKSNLEIRAQFSHLNSQLSILRPYPLSEQAWNTLEKWREAPLDPFVSYGLPIIVAEFKEQAIERIYKRASQTKGRTTLDLYVDAPVKNVGKVNSVEHRIFMDFARDMAFIDNVLFQGRAPISTEFQFGKYSTAQSSNLHAYGKDVTGRTYLSRIHALPIEVIHGDKQRQLENDEYKLIQAAMQMGAGEAARAALRVHGILMPIPLGKIALVRNGATLTCTSPVKQDETVSAFFRVAPAHLAL